MIAHRRDDIMGMPIVIKIIDEEAREKDITEVFHFFDRVDNRFSPFKEHSELSRLNRRELDEKDISRDMKHIFVLSEKTRHETDGYFNIRKSDGTVDTSGIVKGWAIWEGTKILRKKGFKNFFIEAGGDIQTEGLNEERKKWSIGIKNPFNKQEIVKIVLLSGQGIATSGTYEKGQHIYNPHYYGSALKKIVSISVIGPNVYEADRFATAAYAMQEKGIEFIEKQKSLEGYMIDKDGMATMTSGFETYVHNH